MEKYLCKAKAFNLFIFQVIEREIPKKNFSPNFFFSLHDERMEDVYFVGRMSVCNSISINRHYIRHFIFSNTQNTKIEIALKWMEAISMSCKKPKADKKSLFSITAVTPQSNQNEFIWHDVSSLCANCSRIFVSFYLF